MDPTLCDQLPAFLPSVFNLSFPVPETVLAVYVLKSPGGSKLRLPVKTHGLMPNSSSLLAGGKFGGIAAGDERRESSVRCCSSLVEPLERFLCARLFRLRFDDCLLERDFRAEL